MRVRVESSWRTRWLLLLCFLAAGWIAYQRVNSRPAASAAAPAPAADPGVVEVELVGE
ncbi:MAG: hypothetical protein KF729_08500 [Sandaracinaceae bacterium]|nr:hypothetical protein [Sandaracinaceae bacterium]